MDTSGKKILGTCQLFKDSIPQFWSLRVTWSSGIEDSSTFVWK